MRGKLGYKKPLGNNVAPPVVSASLLLHFDGTNGSTTFTDSSLNALTVTANGNPAISTTQSKFGGASGYFDGNSYIQIPGGAALDLRSGDWTVEFWMWANDVNTKQHPIGQSEPNQATFSVELYSGTLSVVAYFSPGGNSAVSLVANSVPQQQWTHVAIVRAGGYLRLYLNGALQASGYGPLHNGQPTAPLAIGTDNTAFGEAFWSYFDGYIDELRIVKGAAAYTGNFTPPTAPFPNPAQPVPALLLHFDGTNGSTTFIDSSPNALTVTANGNAVISTAQSKFGGSSLFMSRGGGGYLSTPYSSALDFGTGDFTAEWWMRLSNTSATAIFGGATQCGTWSVNCASEVRMAVGCSGWDLSSSGWVCPVEQWVHVAVARHSGTLRFFADGVEIASAPNSVSYVLNPADMFTIGTPNAAYTVEGYLDELRIIKGAAAYTGNFTPPTAPFPNPAQPVPALLLHFDGTNGSTTFIDSSPNALTVTANGNAAISTTQSKFGGASGYFDGAASSFLAIPASSSFSYGADDFTIEGWFYASAVNPFQVICSRSTSGNNYCVIGIENGVVEFMFGLGNPPTYVYGSSVTSGAWHHFAVCRTAGVATVYVNGVGGAPVACTFDFSDTTMPLYIGSYGHNTSYNFSGYLDELRIIKGAAAYTGNFTPPTAPF